MNIASTPISPLFHGPATREDRAAKGTGKSAPSFDGMLGQFVGDVNDLQRNANRAVEKLTAGETNNLHQVVVAVEEASLALDLMLEIRNKAIEGYQEIMRMQV